MGEIQNLQNDTLKSKCAHQMFEGTHPKILTNRKRL